MIADRIACDSELILFSWLTFSSIFFGKQQCFFPQKIENRNNSVCFPIHMEAKGKYGKVSNFVQYLP